MDVGKAADSGAGTEPTEDDILKELEQQIEQPDTIAGESEAAPLVGQEMGTTAPAATTENAAGNGGWFNTFKTYAFTVSKEEQDALEEGTREIQKELGKVGAEFNQSMQQIGGLLSGALGIPAGTGIAPVGATKQEQFAAVFPEYKEQEVIEAYECQLVEKFRCYHNAILPEKSFRFRGTLYLTEAVAAFFAKGDLNGFGKSNFPVLLKMEEVDKVQKMGDDDVLKITTKKQVSLFFSSFSVEADFHGASALIENLSQGQDDVQAAEPAAETKA